MGISIMGHIYKQKIIFITEILAVIIGHRSRLGRGETVDTCMCTLFCTNDAVTYEFYDYKC